MPDLHAARREIVLRAKLVFGLFVLGGFLGAILRAGQLAEWPDWVIPQWITWFSWLFSNGWAADLAMYAGIGAAVLGLPALWLVLRGRSRSQQPGPGRKPLKPI